MKASTGLPNDEKEYLDGASAFESDSGLDNEASTSGSAHTKRSDPEAETVAPKPRESVEVAKWSVTFMLLVTAALVTTSTFLFLQREERHSFENAFATNAQTLKDSLEFQAITISRTLNGLGHDVVSEVKHKNMSWPFVTIDDFEIKGAHARLAASVEFILFAPLVHAGEREKWEDYSVKHQGWLPEAQEQSLETWEWLYAEHGKPSVGHLGHAGDAVDGMDHGADMDGDSMEGVDDGDDMDGDTTEGMDHGDSINDMSHHRDIMESMESGNSTGMGSDTMEHGSGNGMSDASHGDQHVTEGNDGIIPYIHSKTSASELLPAPDKALFAPTWQISPPPQKSNSTMLNFDLFSLPNLLESDIDHELTFSSVMNFGHYFEDAMSEEQHWIFHSDAHNQDGGEHKADLAEYHPHSLVLSPVRTGFGDSGEVVGILAAAVPWDLYFSSLLPDDAKGIYAIVHNTCGQVESYVIDGGQVTYRGPRDAHDEEYDEYVRSVNVGGLLAHQSAFACAYYINIYPSDTFRGAYDSRRPMLFTVAMALVFLVTGCIFILYVWFVRRRQEKLLHSAMRTNAIVSSLFPANVRQRLLEQAATQAGNKSTFDTIPKNKLQNFLSGDSDEKEMHSEPIADFFPETTVIFADLVGFTAWASVREPSQVFTLLETIFQQFDELAKRRHVFKVETIGDCYVAVTGLPTRRSDHAVSMARFASDCRLKVATLTNMLEKTLGPDTGDLTMRYGIHSGSVTAGVLRGERARFQLFGDTMNMAARMEQTSLPNRIQVSEATADLLKAAGKSSWLEKRADAIDVKGKGIRQTFWLEISVRGPGSEEPSEKSGTAAPERPTLAGVGRTSSMMDRHMRSDKESRLVEWTVAMLVRLLKQIENRRKNTPPIRGTKRSSLSKSYNSLRVLESKSEGLLEETCTLDETKEIITLPQFSLCTSTTSVDSIELGLSVENELRDFVSVIAGLYRDNNFHNFEHATHVAMSVSKLLARIVAPGTSVEIDDTEQSRMKHEEVASLMHDHTYGITSDPLTQFACVFSALIHDVDHPGVPNTQLVKEKTSLAQHYKGRSVAEQNSVDLTWRLLHEGNRFANLRAAIYSNEEEKCRFRQLVVNSVMATDIMDKDLKALRNSRWEKAFSANPDTQEDPRKAVNRKATIVIEHLIQASDVAHTMQHWHIYRKWNARLFGELYTAYREGRADKDPSEFWYEGEIGFFDFYIIPLAKKLEECGVFGVSSDEYLGYAKRNREEWVAKGKEIVEEMKEKIQ